MKRKLCSMLLLAVVFAATPRSAYSWNETGHQVVARIAWEHMTPTTRRNVVALLQAAPPDACLRNLFSNGPPQTLEVRRREFFMLASTWPDIVRPKDDDRRPCTRFHQSTWHYINYFWKGFSGDMTEPPRDVTTIRAPPVNAVERLNMFRPFVVSNMPQGERATALAWMLHLVGDIHQPLHTSARVTTTEPEGDRGGGLFIVLNRNGGSLTLHGFWDGIVDASVAQRSGESRRAYLERVAATVMAKHPRANIGTNLQPGQFETWTREGFVITKAAVYPRTLLRNRKPGETYRRTAFEISERRIALGGYRLADTLNQLFGS